MKYLLLSVVLTLPQLGTAQDWSDLTDQQRERLESLENIWNDMPQRAKQRVLADPRIHSETTSELNDAEQDALEARLAMVRTRVERMQERLETMEPAERERVEARLERLEAMNEEERSRVERVAIRMREMTPEQREQARERVRDAREWFMSLDEEEQAAVLSRWESRREARELRREASESNPNE